MTMEKAYKIAKEAGYQGQVFSSHGFLLDPKFWKFLCTALSMDFMCLDKKCRYTELAWLELQHRFIDHLAEGKKANSFFKSLLTKKL